MNFNRYLDCVELIDNRQVCQYTFLNIITYGAFVIKSFIVELD